MINHKGIIFFKPYELDNHIALIESLVKQFNEKVGYDEYFENEGFTLLMGSEGEQVYEHDGYRFLDGQLAFPPAALAYDCTICWKVNEKDEYEFYWTSNFPNEELKEYVQNHPSRW